MAIKTTKGDLLDVMHLQETIDQVVFDYLDTSVRHEIAHEQLVALFSEVQTYFTNYITKNNGAIPQPSTYWHMFVSCVSQLSYFLSITTFTTAQQAQALAYAQLAVTTLPKIKSEDDELLVADMKAQYIKLITEPTEQQRILEALTTQRNDVATSLQLLADYMTQHTAL